jgi:hypothetical protein
MDMCITSKTYAPGYEHVDIFVILRFTGLSTNPQALLLLLLHFIIIFRLKIQNQRRLLSTHAYYL